MDSLFEAIKGKDLNMVQRLLNLPGTEVDAMNQHGETPLLRAIEFQNVEIVSELLVHGALPDGPEGSRYPPLWFAVDRNCQRIVPLLIQAGANVDVICNGCTPLAAACKPYFGVTTARMLVEADALVDKFESMAPLHAATKSNSTECVEFLISSGADVNLADSNGRTPLHLAAQREQIGCVQLLLQAGALPNKTDPEGCNALHYLGLRDAKSALVVESLIQAGIDVKHRNKHGLTPLQALSQKYHSSGSERRKKKDDFYVSIQDVDAAITDLVIAGDRSWPEVPTPCVGLEKALLPIYKEAPEDLPQLFQRLEPRLQDVVRNTLILLHGRLHEKSLRMAVLAEVLKPPSWETWVIQKS